jgi:hypothetical protein
MRGLYHSVRARTPVWEDACMGGPLRGVFGFAAVLSAVLCTGCGSSSSGSADARTGGSGSTSSSATKAQFVAQAEAICRTLSAQEKPLKARQQALKGLSAEAADAEFVEIVGKVVAYSQAAESKLSALTRPAADAQSIETLLSSLSQETTDAKAIEQAARKQESSSGEQAQDALKRTIDENLPEAEKYGMKECIAAE